MIVMADANSFRLDFDGRAEEFAPPPQESIPRSFIELLGSGLFGPDTRVLDVGCGTGNYAAALTEATSCRVSGVDPSQRMLDRARDAAPWESLVARQRGEPAVRR